jgi:hypothetical protein
MPNRFLAYSFLPLAAAAAVASPAVAARHPLGTITACRSWVQTGCPTAQVRHGQLGLEYRTDREGNLGQMRRRLQGCTKARGGGFLGRPNGSVALKARTTLNQSVLDPLSMR